MAITFQEAFKRTGKAVQASTSGKIKTFMRAVSKTMQRPVKENGPNQTVTPMRANGLKTKSTAKAPS